MLDRIRTDWDNTSATKRIVLAVVLLAAVVVLALSFSGVIDPFGVSEGVSAVETGGTEVPAAP